MGTCLVGCLTMSKIYEYICKVCTITNREEYVFDLVADEPPKVPPHCPNCGSDKVVRKWNPIAVHFHGDGFYTTDNKTNGDSLPV